MYINIYTYISVCFAKKIKLNECVVFKYSLRRNVMETV